MQEKSVVKKFAMQRAVYAASFSSAKSTSRSREDSIRFVMRTGRLCWMLPRRQDLLNSSVGGAKLQGICRQRGVRKCAKAQRRICPLPSRSHRPLCTVAALCCQRRRAAGEEGEGGPDPQRFPLLYHRSPLSEHP